MGRPVQQGLPRKATVFLDRPPVIEPKGDFFLATYSSGDAIFSVALTPHSLLAGIAAAKAAYDEWDRGQRAVPIGRGRA